MAESDLVPSDLSNFDTAALEQMPVQFWHWLTDPDVLTVFLVVFGTMTANFLARRLLDRALRRAGRTHTVWDDALLNAVRQPMSLLIWVLGISWAAELVSVQGGAGFGPMIEPLRYIAIVAVMAMFLYRFVLETERGFIANGADVTTANAIGKLLRVSVIITAVLSVLQTLGVSVSGVVAFGGIGGIAVGFAAKDLLANFFGGLMIYLDRPFVVGDWIKSPDRQIEGTVEHIGWRLTMIRTFDRRPLYVPNSVFANIAVENPSRMQNRRIYESFGVRYDDASRVKLIVDDVRAMLASHEDIDQERTLIVNLNEFGASSLNFFIYTFTRTTNWVEFHGIKEKVLLQVLAIIEAHGAECAFPTSTVHLFTATEPTES
jgi:MscS family membrane protein